MAHVCLSMQVRLSFWAVASGVDEVPAFLAKEVYGTSMELTSELWCESGSSDRSINLKIRYKSGAYPSTCPSTPKYPSHPTLLRRLSGLSERLSSRLLVLQERSARPAYSSWCFNQDERDERARSLVDKYAY